MSQSPISSYHLSEYPTLYDPARSNCFEFIINENLNKILLAGKDGEQPEDTDYIDNVQEIIRIAAIEFDVPHFSIEPINIRRGNSQVKFAGEVSFESGSLKLNDFVGARVKDAIMAWQALAYDAVNDRVKTADNYKYDCKLVEYNTDMTKIIRTWDLIGCWVSKVSEDAFNHESNDKRAITATIEYDRAIPTSNL